MAAKLLLLLRLLPRVASDPQPCASPILERRLPTLLGPTELADSLGPEGAFPRALEERMEGLTAFWDECNAQAGRLWEVLAPEAPHGIALCAPRACKQRQVRDQIWPRLLRRAGYNGSSSAAEVLELAHWKHLQLDFVLAGFEKCGTSSLSHNLARHPRIEFVPPAPLDSAANTDNQEAQDGNFFWFVGNRLLPPRPLVEAFNKGRCCSGGAHVPGANLTGRRLHTAGRGSVLRGERNPVYAFHRTLMKMVELVPQAKVVLVVCDAIGWLHSAHADTTNWYAASDQTPPPLREFAVADAVAASQPMAQSQPWYNLSRRRALFTEFVRGLVELFGGRSRAPSRVHLLHRDSIDAQEVGADEVQASYNRLAAFLGLPTFPPGFAFERRNIARGRKNTAKSAGLCDPSEAHALDVLHQFYADERARLPEWLMLLGGSVPPRVAENRTHCDP